MEHLTSRSNNGTSVVGDEGCHDSGEALGLVSDAHRAEMLHAGIQSALGATLCVCESAPVGDSLIVVSHY